MTAALRPLSTGELLDRTFSLYRSHFWLFVSIFALPHLVVLAYQLLGVMVRVPGSQLSNAFITLLWGMGTILLAMVFSAVSQAASVVAVSQVHLERPASVMDSFVQVKGHLIGVIGLSLLVTLVIMIGFMALIVPGVILLLMWSLAVQAKVLENKGITDSLSRSSELTKGDRGRVFVIWLLIAVLRVGITWLLQWPILIAAAASAHAAHRAVIGWQVASIVVGYFSDSVVGPLAAISLCLLYYDERVRKEAFDLQLMMTDLDAPALPGSPVQAGA